MAIFFMNEWTYYLTIDNDQAKCINHRWKKKQTNQTSCQHWTIFFSIN